MENSCRKEEIPAPTGMKTVATFSSSLSWSSTLKQNSLPKVTTDTTLHWLLDRDAHLFPTHCHFPWLPFSPTSGSPTPDIAGCVVCCYIEEIPQGNHEKSIRVLCCLLGQGKWLWAKRKGPKDPGVTKVKRKRFSSKPENRPKETHFCLDLKTKAWLDFEESRFIKEQTDLLLIRRMSTYSQGSQQSLRGLSEREGSGS